MIGQDILYVLQLSSEDILRFLLIVLLAGPLLRFISIDIVLLSMALNTLFTPSQFWKYSLYTTVTFLLVFLFCVISSIKSVSLAIHAVPTPGVITQVWD